MHHDTTATELEPDSLLARAAHAAGRPADEIGVPEFRPALSRLVDAIDSEARLTESGRRRTAGALSAALATQMRVRAAVAADPGIAQIEIEPVVITGLYRSGTTFLQHLLAQHPDLRAPMLWELMAPASDEARATLIADAQRYVEEYYTAAPAFRAVHELGAELPEECHRLLGVTFTNSIYALRYSIPSYVEWLNEQPMSEPYRYHRLLLQCLIRRTGNPRVLLKCPTHLWHMDALAATYPRAKVVRVHRSPVVAIPSVCSLTDTVRSARAERVDRREIGAYWLERSGTAIDRMYDELPLEVAPLDIRYADLIADPLGVAGLVCDHIGVPLTDAVAARVRAFLGHQSHVKGAHTYRAEDFGLSEQLLADRFAGYISERDL